MGSINGVIYPSYAGLITVGPWPDNELRFLPSSGLLGFLYKRVHGEPKDDAPAQNAQKKASYDKVTLQNEVVVGISN